MSLHRPCEARNVIVRDLAENLRFFHWELEFPDVFIPERGGFDAIIGNPPWENLQPNPQEFFSDYDPLFRTYGRTDSLKAMEELFGQHPGLHDLWLAYCENFKSFSNLVSCSNDPFGFSGDKTSLLGKQSRSLFEAWKSHRMKGRNAKEETVPFRFQPGRIFTYKLFVEHSWFLLRSAGYLGVIVPSAFYADLGSKPLREELFCRGTVLSLYAFQNEKRIFESAHHDRKQVVLFSKKTGSTNRFTALFRLGVGDSPEAHEIPADILGRETSYLSWSLDELRRFSPNAMSLPEIHKQKDLSLCQRVLSNSTRLIEDDAHLTFNIDFMINSDAKFFPSVETWQRAGYVEDKFYRWIEPNGEVGLPLYQGGMIHQYDSMYSSWCPEYAGRNKWRPLALDAKRCGPRYVISQSDYRSKSKLSEKRLIAFRRISPPTNTRTFICSYLMNCPAGDSIFSLTSETQTLEQILSLTAILNSFVFDFYTRRLLVGNNLNWHVIQNCPLPKIPCPHGLRALSAYSASLTLIHCRFAPEWLN